MNYLVIEALRRSTASSATTSRSSARPAPGADARSARSPTSSSRRLIALFLRDADGRRPGCGDTSVPDTTRRWHDQLLFHEYFHGDTGTGLGASHQTGWTGLVAKLIRRYRRLIDPLQSASRER